jgi:hypothetical protein
VSVLNWITSEEERKKCSCCLLPGHSVVRWSEEHESVVNWQELGKHMTHTSAKSGLKQDSQVVSRLQSAFKKKKKTNNFLVKIFVPNMKSSSSFLSYRRTRNRSCRCVGNHLDR